MTTTGRVHVLIFPYPAQGHMLPLLDLIHHLAPRGVSVTILVTPKNLPILHPILSRHPSIQTLVPPFPPHPSIPPGLENVKDLPIHAFVSMMCALHDLHDPIVNWFRSHPNPPSAIISDMFLGWTHWLAVELGIKRFVFSPSGAFALSVINSLWRNMPERDDDNDEGTQVVDFPEVPNCPKYPWRQLSTVWRSYVAGDPVSEFIKEGFIGNLESWGLVVNSFAELEGVYLEQLRKDLGHDRVWAGGPLLPQSDNDSGPVQRGGSSSVSVEEIKSWLDAREDQTVVYVCFGSQAVLSNDQVRELALGLEKSGVHFVLCVKEPTKEGHVEVEDCAKSLGFEERVAGRGLVIRGWAPQVVILRHRAVGVFLTHCGWNSVLEGVVAGVALLCWPMGADQFSNATMMVEQLKVGIRVCEGARIVPDSDVLARVVADSVSETHVEIRERVKALREAALEAVNEGGSSLMDLDRLVDHLATLQTDLS